MPIRRHRDKRFLQSVSKRGTMRHENGLRAHGLFKDSGNLEAVAFRVEVVARIGEGCFAATAALAWVAGAHDGVEERLDVALGYDPAAAGLLDPAPGFVFPRSHKNYGS